MPAAPNLTDPAARAAHAARCCREYLHDVDEGFIRTPTARGDLESLLFSLEATAAIERLAAGQPFHAA